MNTRAARFCVMGKSGGENNSLWGNACREHGVHPKRKKETVFSDIPVQLGIHIYTSPMTVIQCGKTKRRFIMASVKASAQFRRLCNQFARILGGEHEIDPGPVCFVSRPRNFKATILGRRTTSPLVRYQLFSFESLDRSGRALCLGETALFQNQANRLIRNLQRNGIKVTALHNHWLNESPRLMYIHWESIDNPIDFARKTKRSIAFLG